MVSIPTPPRIIQPTRDDRLVAAFAALAITVHIAESALPSPFPGVKPGLANVVTLLVMCRFGWRMAAWVSLLRVLLGSVLIGTFLSPAFFLSAAGALASIGVLGGIHWANRHLGGWAVGPLGLGIAAALAHMSGQFWVAFALFVPHAGLLPVYPLLMTLAAGLGVVSGLLTRGVLARLNSVSTATRPADG